MVDLANVYGYIIAVFLGLMGAAILFLIVVGKIDLSRLISEPDGEASMSRFQFLIFTFVIAFSLLFVIAKKGDFPTQIPDAIWGLLGISGGSYVISKGIQSSRDTTMEQERTKAAATQVAAEQAAADKAAGGGPAV